ncbi:MAG: hypothetical protein CVU45_01985 [Chloroflexi bacterium HGW-Chloroflexi-7]|nr:MAG: hypothetical protein CVU45_01985 [Chloroflexi bacterium HGW-Chloroflexi-7]
MCAFCVAIPATAVSGMALDQKVRKNNPQKRLPFYLRPYIVLTILVILLLMAASVFFHSRGST